MSIGLLTSAGLSTQLYISSIKPYAHKRPPSFHIFHRNHLQVFYLEFDLERLEHSADLALALER